MYDFDLLESVATELDEFHKYCAVTVALKIADDSCKMDEYERSLFMNLYSFLLAYRSDLFEHDAHQLIRDAQENPTASLYAEIKKEREMAMKIITRNKMKAFKAFVRHQVAKK